LFTAVGGYLSAFVKRKPWIMEVRDLWPESIKVLDALNNNTILDKLETLVQFLYRKATAIVVVTDRFKSRLIEDGVDAKKIFVVKNGVNLDRYKERDPDGSLLNEYQLEGKFIVGYIGTHGMAHGLEVIINAASKVTDSNIHFLFIGHGAYKNRMLALKEKLGLKNVTMLDSIPREKVQDYLSIVDVALIPLRRLETFKTVIPSKIFESAAMGIPILLGVEGESKEIIESYHAGLCFIPEDENSFLEKLNELKDNKSLFQECKKGGLLLAKDFDRKHLADKMYAIIQGLI
jgi:glycosyltransferase involved in cell wall biosynthesis